MTRDPTFQTVIGNQHAISVVDIMHAIAMYECVEEVEELRNGVLEFFEFLFEHIVKSIFEA